MDDQQDGVDPRVLRKKVDLAGQEDTTGHTAELRAYGHRMALATSGGALLALAALFAPSAALALTMLALAGVLVLAALLLFRPKRNRR